MSIPPPSSSQISSRFLPSLLLPVLFLFVTAWVAHGQDKKVSLFDGESLEGWEFTEGVWRIEDGAITAGSLEKRAPRNEFISTPGNYSNFELTLSIRCHGDPATGLINSGIQIRSMRMPNGISMAGYQVDCGVGWFGKIYDEHRRGLIYPEPIDADAMKQALNPSGWNRYRILADGPRIQVWINDVKVSDYTEQHPQIPVDGHIGIQIHGGGAVVVQFKDVHIRELPPTPDAPTWESLGGVRPAIEKARRKPQPEPDKDGYLSAVEQLGTFKVPAGYEIDLVASESDGIGKFVSVYFDQRGRLWTQTALEYPVDGNDDPAAAEALYRSAGRDKVLVYAREGLNKPIPPQGLVPSSVFADGLAIPLGILPWGNGDVCYVHHGRDLVVLEDTDGDGRADRREVILTGFGIQDSHLLPHQFTRAPGDWIWMAQGLFNKSQVKRPGEDSSVPWPGCSMARFRPDGSRFEVASTGPNNIWGLVITGEGETFIQEANDYGYPVMPFHDYAYYPGGMRPHKEPHQPAFPHTADFRMGGTGLSGLALLESGPRQEPDSEFTMLVANPITSAVNAIAMQRNDEDWSLTKLPDFLACDDPNFRPVAMTQGPDGAIYIVDWYNKIISHNEVPRNHPERDQKRGRIWRITTTQDTTTVPDFTRLKTDDLLGMLGTTPTARAHLAAQTLIDRDDPAMIAPLVAALTDPQASDARRVQALWILPDSQRQAARPLLASDNRNIRRELARFPEFANQLADDDDREVRSTALITLGRILAGSPAETLATLLKATGPPLHEPTARASRGNHPIPVGEAYNRAYDRFLIRRFLEQNPSEVAAFLDSEAAANVPAEGRLLAVLSLPPEDSAMQLAAVLPSIQRPLEPGEILRLAEFAHLAECRAALVALLESDATAASVAGQLLALHSRLDAKSIAPLLGQPVIRLFENGQQELAIRLAGTYGVRDLEPRLTAVAGDPARPIENRVNALDALAKLPPDKIDPLIDILGKASDRQLIGAAVTALSASRHPDAPEHAISYFEILDSAQRRELIGRLSTRKNGASSVVDALLDGTLPVQVLDASTVERLEAVLGDSRQWVRLTEFTGDLFTEVLLLDGSPKAWTDPGIDLDGPFTIETWIRLEPGIDNRDGLIGTDGLSVNFHAGKLRFWTGDRGDVLISGLPMTPDLWTHLAVTRDAGGHIRFYRNGEFDCQSGPVLDPAFENVKIGWTPVGGGTAGTLSEFRIWDHARTAEEIRDHFDRTRPDASPAEGLRFRAHGKQSWGKTGKGARVVTTTTGPPLLTPDEAAELDARFVHLKELATSKGEPARGQPLAALCTSCHIIDGSGGNIGPDISGVGASGLDALLRNILTPDAAMEAGYRIFRVQLKNGDLIDAFHVRDEAGAVIIRQPGGEDRRIDRGDIAHTEFLRRSLMPAGLLDPLTDKQAADLLAYLMTLK